MPTPAVLLTIINHPSSKIYIYRVVHVHILFATLASYFLFIIIIIIFFLFVNYLSLKRTNRNSNTTETTNLTKMLGLSGLQPGLFYAAAFLNVAILPKHLKVGATKISSAISSIPNSQEHYVAKSILGSAWDGVTGFLVMSGKKTLLFNTLSSLLYLHRLHFLAI